MAMVPYYQPVAPEVPSADRAMGPQLLADGIKSGLAMYARMTEQRQQSALELQKMAQETAFKEQEFGMEQQKIDNDYELRKASVDSLVKYRNSMTAIQRDPNNPRGVAGMMEIAREKAETYADFSRRAKEYGLLDFNPKNPVDYWAGTRRLEGEFAFARDMPQIKRDLAMFKNTTKEHTVPIRRGRVWDETKGWTGGTDARNEPIGEIVSGLFDPERVDETILLLESNNLTVDKENVRAIPAEEDTRKWFTFGGRKVPTMANALPPKPARELVEKETSVTPRFRRYIEMGKGVDFSRGKAREKQTAADEEKLVIETPPGFGKGSARKSYATEADIAAASEDSTPPPASYRTEPKLDASRKYPVGTKARVGEVWHTMTEHGWEPPFPAPAPLPTPTAMLTSPYPFNPDPSEEDSMRSEPVTEPPIRKEDEESPSYLAGRRRRGATSTTPIGFNYGNDSDTSRPAHPSIGDTDKFYGRWYTFTEHGWEPYRRWDKDAPGTQDTDDGKFPYLRGGRGAKYRRPGKEV